MARKSSVNKNRVFSVFLVLIILAGVMFVMVTPSFAADTEYTLILSTSLPYGLRGETIPLTLSMNLATARIQIYNPSNVLLYDQVWSGSQTRNIPIPSDAEYGTYRLSATSGNCVTTALFTVLDITGFQVLSLPYSVSHKGL